MTTSSRAVNVVECPLVLVPYEPDERMSREESQAAKMSHFQVLVDQLGRLIAELGGDIEILNYSLSNGYVRLIGDDAACKKLKEEIRNMGFGATPLL